ncbi:MAG: hypothetical protein PUA73_01580 [Bacilli bacterium]|nr:hypothetical protein [Bacilli bacterium]
MKLVVDNNITIYLGKFHSKAIDINDTNNIEKQVKKILKALKKTYNLELNGYYETVLYLDENYGLIIKMQKDDLDYLDYFVTALEINIKIKKTAFLYKVEDILNLNKNILKKFIIYKYKKTIYLSAKEKLTTADMGIILENSKVIFDEKIKKIKAKSQIIEM